MMSSGRFDKHAFTVKWAGNKGYALMDASKDTILYTDAENPDDRWMVVPLMERSFTMVAYSIKPDHLPKKTRMARHERLRRVMLGLENKNQK
jgi:hypothetical protein